jgi:protein-S-isoprenylcysteine O-methyltransferase Ste14
MYLAVLILFIPVPIAIGTYWGLILMSALPFALVFRILNEESVLKRELQGYKKYCQKTKYRLLPITWLR